MMRYSRVSTVRVTASFSACSHPRGVSPGKNEWFGVSPAFVKISLCNIWSFWCWCWYWCSLSVKQYQMVVYIWRSWLLFARVLIWMFSLITTSDLAFRFHFRAVYIKKQAMKKWKPSVNLKNVSILVAIVIIDVVFWILSEKFQLSKAVEFTKKCVARCQELPPRHALIVC